MAQLAIKGHSTRGSEVIALLEMLGGINSHNLYGNEKYAYYTIDSDKEIKGGIYVFGDEQLCHFTLEEFEEKFPYKVGDKVWLHYENLTIRVTETITCMRWCNKCNCVLYDVSTCYNLREHAFTPYKEETMKDKPDLLQQLKDYFDSTPRDVVEKEWHGYDKYNEISPKVNEYLEYVNNIRQPKYPKTYEECCKILDIRWEKNYTQGYKCDLISKFQELLIARDAYWKIVGEQMGLGKPWEPDWLNVEQDKYVLYTHNNSICSNRYVLGNNILAFPTAELRDAFFANFKELIESCKELL